MKGAEPMWELFAIILATLAEVLRLLARFAEELTKITWQVSNWVMTRAFLRARFMDLEDTGYDDHLPDSATRWDKARFWGGIFPGAVLYLVVVLACLATGLMDRFMLLMLRARDWANLNIDPHADEPGRIEPERRTLETLEPLPSKGAQAVYDALDIAGYLGHMFLLWILSKTWITELCDWLEDEKGVEDAGDFLNWIFDIPYWPAKLFKRLAERFSALAQASPAT